MLVCLFVTYVFLISFTIHTFVRPNRMICTVSSWKIGNVIDMIPSVCDRWRVSRCFRCEKARFSYVSVLLRNVPYGAIRKCFY